MQAIQFFLLKTGKPPQKRQNLNSIQIPQIKAKLVNLIPAFLANFSRTRRNWHNRQNQTFRIPGLWNFCNFFKSKRGKHRRKDSFFFSFPGKKKIFLPKPIRKKRKRRIHAKKNFLAPARRTKFNFAYESFSADRTASISVRNKKFLKTNFTNRNYSAVFSAAQAFLTTKKKNFNMTEKIHQKKKKERDSCPGRFWKFHFIHINIIVNK